MDNDNEAQVVACGDRQAGFEAEDSSDVEEVQHELEVLKADTIYHDFLVDVALDRYFPSPSVVTKAFPYLLFPKAQGLRAVLPQRRLLLAPLYFPYWSR